MGWREILGALYGVFPSLSAAQKESLWAVYPLLFFLYSFFWSALVLLAARLCISVDSALPWQSRARLTYPPRMVVGLFASMMLIVSLIISSMLYLPEYGVPRWIFIVLCAAGAYLGVVIVSPWLQRWAGISSMSLESFVRMNLSTFAIFVLFYFAGGWCYLTMSTYGQLAGSLAAFAMIVILTKVGFQLGIMWLCGLVQKPSERLRRVAAEAVIESNLGFQPRLCELSTPQANAFAFPGLRLVGVTKRALELFDDVELKGVLHHEFGHLTESRMQRGARLLPLLLYSIFLGLWPWIAAGWNPLTFFPALLAVILVMRIVGTKISRRLEERADSHARIATAGDEAVYAQALQKLYAVNLTPAVMRQAMVTHPNLYDRMEKAGVTPAFERPKPPGRIFKATGIVLTVAATIAFVVCLELLHYKVTHQETGLSRERRHARHSR